MYRVSLSEAERQELHQRTHAKGVMPRTRDRREMVRLSDAGWSIPKIARHLKVDEQRVRYWIKRYLAGGFEALPDQKHVGQPSKLTPEKVEALRAELGKGERTWTASQIAEWLAQEQGVAFSAGWLSRLLRRAKLSYKRTHRGLHHKQKPEEVARKAADLETGKKGHRRG